MTTRYYSSIAQDTTLSANITSGATSMTVTSVVGWPSSTYPFTLSIDYNTGLEELVDVTNVIGNVATITRGVDSTTATAHNSGAVVRHVITARDIRDSNTHINATSSAHAITAISGLGTGVATFLGTPTSANLIATVLDETGSGSLVFGTSPTIASPTITGTLTAGGATGTSGQVLSSTGTGVQWATPATGYTAPTIGSTSITSGGTFTTLPGVTSVNGSTVPSSDTLVGRATTDTLTNKTLTTPTITIGFNAQTATTYTLVASDASKLVTASNASPITITVPPSVFTSGQIINVQQIAAGQVTFAAGSGVTITSTGATPAAPKLRVQYSAASVVCTGTNQFTIVGDIY